MDSKKMLFVLFLVTSTFSTICDSKNHCITYYGKCWCHATSLEDQCGYPEGYAGTYYSIVSSGRPYDLIRALGLTPHPTMCTSNSDCDRDCATNRVRSDGCWGTKLTCWDDAMRWARITSQDTIVRCVNWEMSAHSTRYPSRLPTQYPTQTPSGPPSLECVDKYSYCPYGSFTGACYNQDHDARMSFLNDCPYSCMTCHGETLIPTYHPTSKRTNPPTVTPTYDPSHKPTWQTVAPTTGPTNTPTCIDILSYCNFVKANCSSSDFYVQTKMENECSFTCGFCTSQPTVAPSAPCVDAYSYCPDAAGIGCWNTDYEVRSHFHIDCPVSCNTCHNKTLAPSYQPTTSPTLAPTCVDVIGYCNTLIPYCNSSSVLSTMQSVCSSTCGFCTSEPTVSPACADGYTYCGEVALAGACHNNEYEARLQFLNDCPVSCNSCYNQSMAPTFLPTFSPTLLPTAPSSSPSMNPTAIPTSQQTRAPTNSPTCSDLIGYCGYVKKYCNSSDSLVRHKLQKDCSYTCGICSAGSVENLEEDKRRRFGVTDQSLKSIDPILVICAIFLGVISSKLILHHVCAWSDMNFSKDRKNALSELTTHEVMCTSSIVKEEGQCVSASSTAVKWDCSN